MRERCSRLYNSNPSALQDQKLFGWLKGCYPGWQHMTVREHSWMCTQPNPAVCCKRLCELLTDLHFCQLESSSWTLASAFTQAGDGISITHLQNHGTERAPMLGIVAL